MKGRPRRDQPLRGAAEPVEIAGGGGDQDRRRRHLRSKLERRLAEAQHEIGAGAIAALELAEIGAVDADGKPERLHRSDRFLEMGEGRRRQAAEIDHLGAVGGKRPGARQDAVDRELRRVDDLGEDAHVMGVEIDRFAGAAEEGGQVVKIGRPALDGDAELAAEAGEIALAMAGNDDPVGAQRVLRQAAADEVGGHQRRDLDADVVHRPGEVEITDAVKDAAQPLLGEMPGQEQGVSRHCSRRLTLCSSSTIDSTTSVASNCLSRSTFSRSMRRG